MIKQINQLKQGSIISGSPHYIVNKVSGSKAWLTHFESGEEVWIGMSYLKNCTNSADLFETTVKVIKEDKKGVANAAKNLITELVNNPVLPYEEGEDRVLRGYKIQFESRDGRYDCVDMDITKTDKESGVRPVNINTIKYLIFDGVKYVVE